MRLHLMRRWQALWYARLAADERLCALLGARLHGAGWLLLGYFVFVRQAGRGLTILFCELRLCKGSLRC